MTDPRPLIDLACRNWIASSDLRPAHRHVLDALLGDATAVVLVRLGNDTYQAMPVDERSQGYRNGDGATRVTYSTPWQPPAER